MQTKTTGSVLVFLLAAFLGCNLVWCADSGDGGESSEDAADIQTSPNSAAGLLGAQDVIKTKAVEFFILRKYQEALEEFRVMEAKHPESLLIRRYIGVCLSELRQDDEASIVFQEILRLAPKDLPTLKFLAKMHLRRAEILKAKARFQEIVDADSSGRFSIYAKSQLERLEAIESATSAQQEAGRQISPDEFLKTKAAIHFMDAKYEESILEFTLLESQYPEDVTVKRYKGMALDKLGRFDEAIEAFNQGLKAAPNNTALHYALAQAHFHKKDIKKGSEELRYISSNDQSDYKMKADRDLEVIERIGAAIRLIEAKPWSVSLEQGFEFNSNAASEPKKLQVLAEEHAVRFPGSLSVNYRLKKDGPWTLSASYAYFHSFYSDTLDYINTRVQAPAMTLMRQGTWAGKAFITLFSSSYTHVSVENEFYYQSYPQTLRFVYSFWDGHRIIFSEKFAWTDYKDLGSNPTTTSREGISNAINVANNFYFSKKRDLYLGVGYEFKVEDTEGSNYVRNIHQTTADFNFPLAFGWLGTINFGYKNSDYPETTANIQRLDKEYSTGARIVIPLSEVLSLKLNYSYLNNNSNDPVYNYVNHAGGSSLALSF